MTALLQGLRALDLTTPIGADCGRVLASFGVDVVRIDAPGARGEALTQDELIRWRASHLGKRAVTLDLETPEGRELMLRLVRQSHFVIESFVPGRMAELGLDYATLKAAEPGVIFVSISPFGQLGPYAHYKGGELVASAMSGVLTTLGDPDRPPVKEALDANCYHGAAAAALGALMAYYERQRTGLGQHVDLSLQEAGVARNSNNLLLYQFDKRCVQRGGPFLRFGKASIRVVWKLADGYMFFSMATGRFGAPANRALSAWLDELNYDNPMREVDWDRYDRSALDPELRKVWEAALSRFFADRTKAQINSEGRRRGINAAVANEIDDLLEDPQLAAREYFSSAQWPESTDTVRAPKYFLRTGDGQSAPRFSTPGADNERVYADILNLSLADIAALEQQGIL